MNNLKWYIRIFTSTISSIVCIIICILTNHIELWYCGVVGSLGFAIIDHTICYFRFHRKRTRTTPKYKVGDKIVFNRSWVTRDRHLENNQTARGYLVVNGIERCTRNKRNKKCDLCKKLETLGHDNKCSGNGYRFVGDGYGSGSMWCRVEEESKLSQREIPKPKEFKIK